ncbi:MAG TPA: amidohydrolase [Saprospiraceae bacterium]|nr:amidohydrolase [Saprospiraceae bacterium]
MDNSEKADLILYNAFVCSITSSPIENGAVVIYDGKIVEVGTSKSILEKWTRAGAEIFDCKGLFLMPGLIEGHAHFSSLGLNLLHLDLLATTSWQEIMDSVQSRTTTLPPGTWVLGRGWHQEKWIEPVSPNVSGYPYHDSLSAISSKNPVMLTHASGHSLYANKAAMNAAGISNETADPSGGKILRDQKGNAIGVFEENAMDIIQKAFKEYEASLTEEEVSAEWYSAIEEVQAHCLSYGITSFQDAGSTFIEIERYKTLAEKDSLHLRLWAMLRQPLSEIKDHLDGFPIIGVGEDKFTSRTIKAYIDGALGSYGAWLLEPYIERPGFYGQNTTPVEEINAIAELCIAHGMQMAVHAIGDKANRTVLDIYEKAFKANPDKKNLRWRIEHAQHIDPVDIPRFKELNVIASMQAIHCISDAPFVEKRIGYERAKNGAYAWRTLFDNGVVIANGTDAPVERVDPFQNLYAAVTRKRIDNGQEFFPEQSMTREEALQSYTINNAYAAFEEDVKGSIEPGKWADFALLSQNLLTCPEDSILKTKVLLTIVGGKIMYRGAEE